MNSPEQIEPAPQPLTSAGTILAQKREEWGLSIQEVAANLNLSTETIEALEADEYDSLPGTTFIKGYIRSYAKLLQLDVENLMGNIDLQPERITEIPSTRAALKLKGKTRIREKNGKKSGVLKWFVILVVLAGLVAFGLSQLPKFGIGSLTELFDRAGLQSGQEDTNQLVIPNQDGTEDGKKEALIRIE